MRHVLIFILILTTSGVGGQSPRRMDSVFAKKVNKALDIIPNLATSLEKQSKSIEKQAAITERLYDRASELRVQNDTLRALFISAEIERAKYQEINRQLLNKVVAASEQAEINRNTERAFDLAIVTMLILMVGAKLYVHYKSKKIPLKYVG